MYINIILSLFQFPCKYCGRGYKNRRVLQLHEASHLARKEFNCHICDYSASRKDLLKAHIKGVHDNERNEICPLCGKRFLVSFCIIIAADSSYCNYCRLTLLDNCLRLQLFALFAFVAPFLEFIILPNCSYCIFIAFIIAY